MAELLTAIHDTAKSALHIVFIPIVGLLKALIAGLSYVHDEAAKI